MPLWRLDTSPQQIYSRCITNEEFCIKNERNCIFKMTSFALKMMSFVFKVHRPEWYDLTKEQRAAAGI